MITKRAGKFIPIANVLVVHKTLTLKSKNKL